MVGSQKEFILINYMSNTSLSLSTRVYQNVQDHNSNG